VGLTRESTWQSLSAGRSGITEVTRFDATGLGSRVAGEVKDFNPLRFVSRRELGTWDLFQLYALATALEAVADAGLEGGLPSLRTGVVWGVGLGGIASMERYHSLLRDKGPRRVSPFLVPMMIPNMAACAVSLRLGTQGPCEVLTTACASGAHAVAQAGRWLGEGTVDVVIAGGAEAAITPLTFAGFDSMRALSRRNDSPSQACRPFDQQRDGFVLAEGAAALVLERSEHVQDRRQPYAELAGWASTADAHHITQPAPEGAGQARCMTEAMARAGMEPEEIGYINAHGTGTKQNDLAESTAILKAFGEKLGRQVPVSSTKSMTGHLLGAAGALEAAVTALALQRQLLPPTINLEHPDEGCELAHLVRPRSLAVQAALSNSFGFGGTNATLVLKRWLGNEDEDEGCHR
jgi:3-oxoacyl-[acyl-carrier-protein] synthase II